MFNIPTHPIPLGNDYWSTISEGSGARWPLQWVNRARYTDVLKLCHHYPALLLGCELHVLPLCIEAKAGFTLAFSGYAVVGDNFHDGNSANWTGKQILQL